MNTIVILAILGLVIAGVGVAVYVSMNMGGGTVSTNTTSTPYTETSTISSTTTSFTSSRRGYVDIAGAWHGVYNGTYGSGRWSFKIWRSSGNKYVGLLRTDGTYRTEGSIPLTITLSGNKITLGAVGIGATFTGTVSEDSISGT